LVRAVKTPSVVQFGYHNQTSTRQEKPHARCPAPGRSPAGQSELPLNSWPSLRLRPGREKVASQHWPFSDCIWAVSGTDRGGRGSPNGRPVRFTPFALSWIFALPAPPDSSLTLATPVALPVPLANLKPLVVIAVQQGLVPQVPP